MNENEAAAGRAPASTPERRFRARLLAAAVGVAVVLYAVSVPIGAAVYGVNVAAMFALALLTCGAIPLAVRMPWVAAVAASVSANVFTGLSAGSADAPWPWPVTTIIAAAAMLIVAGLTRPWWTGLGSWAIVALPLVPWGFRDAGAAADAIAAAAIALLALAAAIAIAARRTIARELFQEREHAAEIDERRVLVEERNRIARELHDVVAHGLSLIHVRATSAPYRVEGLPPEATAEFGEIAASARTALGEMRQLLAVLRSEETVAESAPQPGIPELDALIDSVESAGVPVERSIGAGLPDAGILSTTVYRIVQESLSNTVRHAPGAAASVDVDRRDGRITVRVVNGPAPQGDARVTARAERETGGGHGLIGMRERATALGGQVEYGETADGGFRVLAVLPAGERPDDEERP
ncbi:sensor histidine kinase [Agromyces archimandritae]|uniref:histidine kinase n=1 Tax=Agromyces archimandritae TaxID=2781962 RepID=A0A975IPL8_9MICO|nr:histidine kinase [Agromyces archimandritae]QTX05752.1 sensor histidine kinase [Agromyces archimandritae]